METRNEIIKRVIGEMKSNIKELKENEEILYNKVEALGGELEIYENLIKANNKIIVETYHQIKMLGGMME